MTQNQTYGVDGAFALADGEFMLVTVRVEAADEQTAAADAQAEVDRDPLGIYPDRLTLEVLRVYEIDVEHYAHEVPEPTEVSLDEYDVVEGEVL